MQVSIENKEGVKRLVTVTVPAADVKASYDKSLKNVSKKARIDGFRKGHIPTKILEEHFGYQIITDAVDALINDTLFKALEENGVKSVGRPSIDFGDKGFKKDEDFTYKATVEVFPEIEVKPYEELDVQNIVSEVTDQDVENMIEKLREQQAKWQVKDDLACADGNMAKIDFLGRVDGTEFPGGKATDFSLQFGKSQMIPGFSEQILGHKAGDKFTIKVTFPAEYHAEELKGKDAEFDITVKSVSEQILPEVNADFMKLYDIKDGNIDTFRASLRKNMERELSRKTEFVLQNDLNDALLKQYGEFEVPSFLMEREIERLRKQYVQNMQAYLGGKEVPEDKVNNEMFTKQAVGNLRVSLIVSAIAAALEFKGPSDEYVEKALDEIAYAYEDPEEVKKEIRSDKKTFAVYKDRAYQNELVARIVALAGKGDKHMTFDELIGQAG